MKIYEKKIDFKQYAQDMEKVSNINRLEKRIDDLEKNVNMIAKIVTDLINEIDGKRNINNNKKNIVDDVFVFNQNQLKEQNKGLEPDVVFDRNNDKNKSKVITSADELIKKSLGNISHKGGNADTIASYFTPEEKEEFLNDNKVSDLANVFILSDKEKERIAEAQAVMVSKMQK